MTAPDEHAALAQVLTRLQAGVDASELHGALSGYLCAGGNADAGDWLERLEITPGADGATADPSLRDVFERVRAQFATDPAQVKPLLPPSQAKLDRRGRALVEWCRGFLGGFGLASGAASAHLPAEGEEILSDLGMIAGTRLNGDDDETSFDEVLAFVQTAVALLHRHVQAAQRAAARSVH
jgi:uncharacterized protein YgfB (UPF0149 family)